MRFPAYPSIKYKRKKYFFLRLFGGSKKTSFFKFFPKQGAFSKIWVRADLAICKCFPTAPRSRPANPSSGLELETADSSTCRKREMRNILFYLYPKPSRGTSRNSILLQMITSGCPQIRNHMRWPANPSIEYKRKMFFSYTFWEERQKSSFFKFFSNERAFSEIQIHAEAAICKCVPTIPNNRPTNKYPRL